MAEENLYAVTVKYRVRAEDASMAEYKIRTSGYEIEGVDEVFVELLEGEEPILGEETEEETVSEPTGDDTEP